MLRLGRDTQLGQLLAGGPHRVMHEFESAARTEAAAARGCYGDEQKHGDSHGDG